MVEKGGNKQKHELDFLPQQKLNNCVSRFNLNDFQRRMGEKLKCRHVQCWQRCGKTVTAADTFQVFIYNPFLSTALFNTTLCKMENMSVYCPPKSDLKTNKSYRGKHSSFNLSFELLFPCQGDEEGPSSSQGCCECCNTNWKSEKVKVSESNTSVTFPVFNDK